MTSHPTAPPYGQGTLAEVMPSAGALLAVPGMTDSLGLSEWCRAADGDVPHSVTVLLVDGLGWSPWREMLADTPALAGMQARSLSTTFPSTTPTALASLGTALTPGGHGLVGAGFLLPEDGDLLHPLSWGRTPHPLAVQPEPTIFERVARAGLPVASVGPRAYADSGLTRAGLRGGYPVGGDTYAEVVEGVAMNARGLTYAYVADLDRTGHVFGVSSAEWLQSLAEIDSLVDRILDQLCERDLLLVTADHGMVDCAPHDRVRIEDLPGQAGIVIGGEPRMRHIYCPPEDRDSLIMSWRQELGDRAWVLSREESINLGLFGPVLHDYDERIGDLVVIARGTTALTSETDSIVSGLRGQHGAVTDAEMRIPLLQARGRRPD
ncbi:MAG: alkaline phosphatase family protein [Candidatus Nanopelagicales bacterium]|nr:alkaline phosphatase family protein [Candidatus Nanopelagicales bacterium]MDP4906585.1 alkaline phosphatase family protein [Candidatus Nanopelagicales bacterium]MDP4974451.1 alkaline phosphatase family protein [Candidatus Nanopelagicales bacterium]